MKVSQTILIFDGDCNLCNRWVRFVSRRDPERKFSYVPNQSEEGMKILKDFGKPVADVSTIYLLDKGKLFERSSAVLKIFGKLRFPWKLGVVLWIFPRFLRDWFYNLVAKYRKQLGGQKEVC